MRVLFISPNLYKQMGFNHGLASLSSILKAKGHETSLLNLNERLPPVPGDEEIFRAVVDGSVGLIGFSCLTMQYREAVRLARLTDPTLVIDGEMQADTALVPELAREAFPMSSIQGDANVLVFPDLQAGNIAYKLVQRLAGAEVIGPVLLGLAAPANVLNHYSSVDEIVNIAAITVLQARRRSRA